MPGRSTIRIGRWGGSPIGIHPLWLVILALLTWSLGSDDCPSTVRGLSTGTAYALGLASARTSGRALSGCTQAGGDEPGRDLEAPGYRDIDVERAVERAIPGTLALGDPSEVARVDTNSRISSKAAIIIAVLALLLGGVVINTMTMAVIGALFCVWQVMRVPLLTRSAGLDRRAPCARPALSSTRGVSSAGHAACRATAPETLPTSARRTGR